ncbi:MAG: WD40 repeat domain-containing protein, partial [Anaerolineae bacterium]
RAQIQPDENEVFRGYDLSPDESLLVTHSAYSISGASVQDGVIRFWDMASGQRQNDLGELPASNAYGDAVRFSPDGLGVAYISAAQPYSIVLWDISTHQNRLVIQPQGFYGLSLVGFAENGTLLVTIGSSPAVTETQIYVWDTTTGTLQASIPSSSLSLSIAGNTLILWDEQQRLTLWDVRTGHERAVYGSRQQHIANADFSPDGLHLLVTGRDQMLQLWALSSPPTAQAFSRHWEPLLEIESISDPDILIHDYQNILHRYRLDMENGTRDSTALSAPFASHEGEDVVVLNPLTDVELGRLPIAGYYATEVLSADGTLLATANALNGSSTQAQQGEIVLWEVASGTQRCVLAGSTRQGVPYLRFQQNGTLLVSGGADGTVQFWDASTCQSRAALYLQSGYLLALAFSPDERLVYTASSSGRIVEWNVQSGLGTLLRDDGYTQTLLTNEILMSSDGSLLILRNDSGRSVRFMNTSGAVLGVLPGEIFRMQLSVDGATLVTSDFNGLLHVWRIRP